MSEDEFTRLFKYMTEQFADVHASINEARAEFRQGIDGINNRLDELHSKADIDDTERLVMTKQLNQHEGWIEQAGEKIGL